nr:DUF3828 domain-containing protein [uncultured Rhodopila sp.]
MRRWAAAGFILLGSCAGGAAPNDDPDAFVRTLYARFKADPNFFILPGGTFEAAVYSPSLLQVLTANRAFHAKNSELGLDGDPICDCQEHEWMTTPRIVVHRTGQASAEATVDFVIEDFYVRSMMLNLVQTPAGWRLDDIGDTAMPSLRKWLVNDMK